MHYQVFVPGARGNNPELLKAVGLDDHAAGASYLQCGSGPEGLAGVVVSWKTPDAKEHGYRPDEQTWIPAVPADDPPGAAKRYWIGLWNGSPPTPAELEKPQRLDGYLVELGDGNKWAVPAAVWLPADLTLGPEGLIRQEVQHQYRAFWERACAWYRRLMDAEGTEVALDAPEDYWAYLCDALRFNYRITPEVCSHLRLFTTTNRLAVIMATVQGQLIARVEEQKKTGADASPSPVTPSHEPGDAG